MMELAILAAVRSFVLLGLASVVVLLLRRASIRHAVWTAAVIGCAVAPFIPRALPSVVLALPPSTQPARAQSVSLSPIASRGAQLVTGRDAFNEATSARELLTRRTVIVVGWLSIALLLVGRVLRSLGSARRLGGRAVTPVSATIVSAADYVRRRHDLTANARLALTSELESAATFGFMRHSVLLPADAERWPADRLHAVLAHELAHAQRRDCLTQTAAQLVCAVYWFNPLAWLAVRRMAIERERACDDIVLAGGVSAVAYASTLIDAVRRGRANTLALRGTIVAMSGTSEIEKRVRRILDHAVPRRVGRLGRLATAVICALMVFLAGSVRVSTASALQFPRPSDSEPDLLRDSVAAPGSERIPGTFVVDSMHLRAIRSGPDSILARQMSDALARTPRWDGDLVRDRARWVLSHAHGTSLVVPLIELLADADWRARAYASWSLGHSGDRRATGPLVAQLDHPVWRVRANAAAALSHLSDPNAREFMIGALDDPAWQVRWAVVSYLSALDDPELTPVLRGALRDRHIAVRHVAERALSSRK